MTVRSKLFWCVVLLSLCFTFSACNKSSDTSISPQSPAGPTKEDSKPATPLPSQEPSPSQPGLPQADAKALLKKYRALYTIVSRNQKKVCVTANLCRVWADRLDADYVDLESGKVIPQLLAWKLILSQSGSSSSSSTMSLVIPFFSDRGTTKIENGSLIYDFAGKVGKIDAGTFDMKLHVSIAEEANGNTLLHLDLTGIGQDFHDDYEMTRVVGTNLDDAPAGVLPGVIAVYEWGQNGGGYEGFECTISYHPESPYYLWATSKVIVGGEKVPAGSLQFKMDSETLFPAAMALWNSHGSVTSHPDLNNMNYYAVYAPDNGKSVEIPVYGIGMKDATNDAPTGAVYNFTKAVKALCDQINY